MKLHTKKFLTVAFALLVSASFSFGQANMTVDSVFAKYYAATGGEKLWDNIKNYSLKRTYSSNSSADYDSQIYVSMPDKAMTKTKSIMKRDFVYGVKGSEGWLKIPIGGSDKAPRYQVKDLSQAEQDNMRLEMYDLLVPFVNYKDRNLVATYVGLDQIDGVPVNHVELQGQGVKYNLYFDAKTGLLKREKQTLAGIVTTIDYDKYKKSKYGLMYPSALVEMSSRDNSKITIISEMVVNETIAPENFQR